MLIQRACLIKPYHAGQRPIAIALPPGETEADQLDYLRRGRVVVLARLRRPPYNAVIRLSLPSVEGNETFDYLAKIIP